MQAIRSVLFTAFLMLSACVWGFTMGLCFFLPQRKQFAMGRGWARCVLWLLERVCGLRSRPWREHPPARMLSG